MRRTTPGAAGEGRARRETRSSSASATAPRGFWAVSTARRDARVAASWTMARRSVTTTRRARFRRTARTASRKERSAIGRRSGGALVFRTRRVRGESARGSSPAPTTATRLVLHSISATRTAPSASSYANSPVSRRMIWNPRVVATARQDRSWLKLAFRTSARGAGGGIVARPSRGRGARALLLLFYPRQRGTTFFFSTREIPRQHAVVIVLARWRVACAFSGRSGASPRSARCPPAALALRARSRRSAAVSARSRRARGASARRPNRWTAGGRRSR